MPRARGYEIDIGTIVEKLGDVPLQPYLLKRDRYYLSRIIFFVISSPPDLKR